MRLTVSGKSMLPTISENEVITISPVENSDIKRGDVVLYESLRGPIVHRVVKRAQSRSEFFLLRGDHVSSRLEFVNGSQILGIVTSANCGIYNRIVVQFRHGLQEIFDKCPHWVHLCLKVIRSVTGR